MTGQGLEKGSGLGQARLSGVPLGLGVLDLLLLAGLQVLHLPGRIYFSLILLGLLGALCFWFHSKLVGQIQQNRMDRGRDEQFLESVADLSQDFCAMFDARTGKYLYLNNATEKLLGYARDEWLKGGQDFLQACVHPDDQLYVKQQLQHLLDPDFGPSSPRQEEPVQEDSFRIRTHWDEYRWFRIRRTVFTRDAAGLPVEVLEVGQDITEQRGFEIALVQAQEFESLGTLARRLAHDLSNIVMGIQGYADLGLDEGKGEGDPKQSLIKIRDGAGRAAEICRQMLSYAGRGRVQIGRHQINESIREALPLVESLLPENAELILDLENDLPIASVDPNQIRYALLNLVVNAVECLGTSKGEIIVRTFVKHLGGQADPVSEGLQGDYLCLNVRDSGIGMSEETLGGITDPFFRIKHPGRGLGLLTVKGIATEHRGALHIETEPGRGSDCTLYFPMAGHPQLPDQGDEGTPIATDLGVILVVDDEPTIRAVLREGLENAGYKVIEAVDGVDGFGAFVRHRSSISAVLLDLTMPRMHGDEVFEEIRRLDPKMPVILMSGYSKREATSALTGKGLAAFLSKPCSIKEALSVVQKALER
jgi:PAS domain S-box-containing protein